MDILHSAAVIIIVSLLSISACAYAAGLFVLLTRRRMPAEIAPPRVAAFGALVLCAAKAILGATIAQYQAALTGLILIATLFAVYKMVAAVVVAFSAPDHARLLIHRWAAVLIPPMASIALLGILDTLPEQDYRMLITAFMTINLIPALYVLVSAKSFFTSESPA